MTNPVVSSTTFKRIRIENLAASATEVLLRGLFLAHGHIVSYERPLDVATGRPGPLAYVEMASDEADIAIEMLNGHQVEGMPLLLSAQLVASWAPDADRHAHSRQPRRTVLPPSVAPTRTTPEAS